MTDVNLADDLISRLTFDSQGLVPAIVQDATSGDVRMLGYMNREALDLTVRTGLVHFWSRGRQQLWKKGETSGNLLHALELRADCDSDTLLVKVRADGPTCHTGTETCFEEGATVQLQPLPLSSRVVDEVAAVIRDRVTNPVVGSYTNYLLMEGIDKIGKKIGEEAAEVIIAAKNGEPQALAAESSDLIYHLLVMLEASGVEVDEVWKVLATRRGRSQSDHPAQ